MYPARRFCPFLLLSLCALPARADEGMWLFDHFPVARLEKSYGFKADSAFLDHVRLSAVRFNNGGSASFVSPNGLIVTNHHVGRDCIAKLSTARHDYEREGYLAATPADEARCPDLEINVLVGIEDVTARIQGLAPVGALEAERNRLRREASIKLEQDCAGRTGDRCDVVTLDQGGAYKLYQYKRYTDIRLVFAPEEQLAFYGGHIDNFEYPRYNLDIAFFRAYEQNAPAKTPQFLKIQPKPLEEGQLVFAAGNPGSTERNLTLAHLALYREEIYPRALARYDLLEKRLLEHAARGKEQARQAQNLLFGVRNGQKRFAALYKGLQDPARMTPKAAQEKAFRDAIASHPEGRAWEEAFTTIERSLRRERELYARYDILETAFTRSSYGTLPGVSRMLLRMAEESAKPNEKRLPEYSDASLVSLKQQLFSPAPIYPGLEATLVGALLTQLQAVLGPDDPTIKTLLQGRTPDQAALAMVQGSKLDQVAVRQALAEGGAQAIAQSQDPMLQLARLLDPLARDVRKAYEDEVQAVQRDAYAQLTRARVATSTAERFPDANFTLRLTYGKVAGYQEDGKNIRYYTDFRGMYALEQAHGGQPPYDLPKRWKKARTLNQDTHFNFVATLDTTGGNSGSPAINQQGELVGVLFDSNRHKIANDLIYSDEGARAVVVCADGIMEALRSIYRAEALIKELEGC